MTQEAIDEFCREVLYSLVAIQRLSHDTHFNYHDNHGGEGLMYCENCLDEFDEEIKKIESSLKIIKKERKR